MSQLILDEQLDIPIILPSVEKWITVQRLQDLRPNEQIGDDRVPALLLMLRQPTFLTIDPDFWSPRLCHPNYCILFFALRTDQQQVLPGLLRSLLRRAEFRTRASRMGKVARISPANIELWQFQRRELQRLSWKGIRR